MSVFSEAKFWCHFPETLSAKSDPIFLYVRSKSSAASTFPFASTMSTLLWLAKFKELVSFCGFVCDLLQQFFVTFNRQILSP